MLSMTQSTEEQTSVTDSTTHPIDVVIIAVPVGASCLLIVVIVVSLVCLRRRRKRREAPPLPSPKDEIPEENADRKTHNLVSILTNERSQNTTGTPDDLRPNAVTTPKPKNRAGNYENVSTGRPPGDRNTIRDGKNEIETESETESESDSPDYENNPDSIAKVAADAAARLENRRKNPTPTPAESSHAAVGARPVTTAARQTRTLDAKANACPDMVKAKWGSAEVRQDLCEHEPTKKKSCVKTASPSRSLEDLVNRRVPQPPSLPSSFKENKAAPVAAKPPKPHAVKARGYVNQPVY